MRYFKNNYKSLIMPAVFLTIIGLVAYVIPLMFTYNYGTFYLSLNLEALGMFLTGAAIFIPIYEFNILKSKRGGDLYYSLPINKRKLNLQIFIKGLIELLISYFIVFISGILIVLIKGFELNYIYYLPMFFMLLLGVVALYSINSFIFSKANNIVDGIIFIGLYLLVVMLGFSVLSDVYWRITKNTLLTNESQLFTPLMMLNYFSYSYNKLLTSASPGSVFTDFDVLSGTMFTIWFVVGIVCFNLQMFLTKFNKAENIQQVSNTWFGYKILIPIYLLLGLVSSGISLDYAGEIFVLAVFVIIAYIGYVVYERTFKVKWSNLLTILIIVIIAVVINATTMNIRF